MTVRGVSSGQSVVRTGTRTKKMAFRKTIGLQGYVIDGEVQVKKYTRVPLIKWALLKILLLGHRWILIYVFRSYAWCRPQQHSTAHFALLACSKEEPKSTAPKMQTIPAAPFKDNPAGPKNHVHTQTTHKGSMRRSLGSRGAQKKNLIELRPVEDRYHTKKI